VLAATLIVGLNGLRLLRAAVWPAPGTVAAG
jgi:hypothetical protein